MEGEGSAFTKKKKSVCVSCARRVFCRRLEKEKGEGEGEERGVGFVSMTTSAGEANGICGGEESGLSGEGY